MLCTGSVAGRLSEPAARARSLYCSVLLAQMCGELPAPWLRSGLISALAECDRPGALAALNRRMLAALSDGTIWSEDMFTSSARRLSKVLFNTKVPRTAQRSQQFGDQAWSIVDYLLGESAPESRRASFRAFLKDKRSNSHHSEAFFQHFGFGFGTLLDLWREWVLARGIGTFEPPPADVRKALTAHVLPMIRDHTAARSERLQAIRDWCTAGAACGAELLIGLLRDPGEIPTEEITWALRGVSGMPWGDEPDRWQAWFDALPASAGDLTASEAIHGLNSLASSFTATNRGQQITEPPTASSRFPAQPNQEAPR
jgi:hypothetical protein